MIIERKYLSMAILAGAAVLGMAQPSAARSYRGGRHYYHRSGRRYGRGGGYGGSYGGYLNGAANIINAQGRFLINTQQAYLIKEGVRAAQLQNRRNIFDEHLYEKSLRPTLNDRRVLEQQQELRRALTHPPETEIWSGKSLNDLLTHIKDLRPKDGEVPDVSLSPDTLQQINLTVRHVGNVGLLKAADRLNWPLGLQILEPRSQTAAMRSRIEILLSEGKKQASNTGQVESKILVQLEKDVNELRGHLVSQVAEYSFGDYTHAKNYLGQLDQAVAVLQQPDAGNYFNGKYRPKGETVVELVQYMTENGLKFAPAISGEEAAYSGLFAAMVQFYLDSGSTVPSQSATRDFYRGLYRQTRMYHDAGK